MTIAKNSFRIATAIVVAAIAGSAVASTAFADDRHDRDWHRDHHVGRDRDWHRHGPGFGIAIEPPVIYAPPPVYYQPPPPPPFVGFGIDLRLR